MCNQVAFLTKKNNTKKIVMTFQLKLIKNKEMSLKKPKVKR